MRKRSSLLTLLAFLAPAGAAHAAEFRFQEVVTIGPDEVVQGDLYASGERLTIDGRIEGDLIVVGEDVTIAGEVTGDVMAAGRQVVLRGTVGDDVRAAGGEVSIEGKIGDHAALGGGQVRTQPHADVRGDLWVAGGQVTLAGDSGAVMARTGTLTVAESAHVRGNLTSVSGKEPTIAQGATIDGVVQRNVLLKGGKSVGLAAVGGVVSLISLVASFIAGALFLRFLPNKSRHVALEWRTRLGSNLLWGVLTLILPPLVSAVLIVTIVGAPLGIGVLLLYPVVLYLGYIVGALATGHWLREMVARASPSAPNWKSLFLGAVVLTVLGGIPIIGELAVFFVFLTGLGALVRFDWGLAKRLRAEQTI